MLKYFIATLFFALLTFVPALAAGPEALYTVETSDGRSHNVTELLEVKQEKVGTRLFPYRLQKPDKFWKLWQLRPKKGEKWRTYKTFQGTEEFPLTLSEADYKLNKDVLKDVPDNRSYDVRHPKRHGHQEWCKRWQPVCQFWFGPALTAVQGVAAARGGN